MKIGQNGLDTIKAFEGLRLTAYMPTPHDVPTIGYGHTRGVLMGTSITEEEADAFLLKDLTWVQSAVNSHVKVPLTQNQYDALCSFTYNLGATNLKTSTLLRRLNYRDYEGAGLQLLRWNKQKGKVLRGLTRRRKVELELWNTPDTPKVPEITPAPSGGLMKALMALIAMLLKKRG
jgi:lysozyme